MAAGEGALVDRPLAKPRPGPGVMSSLPSSTATLTGGGGACGLLVGGSLDL